MTRQKLTYKLDSCLTLGGSLYKQRIKLDSDCLRNRHINVQSSLDLLLKNSRQRPEKGMVTSKGSSLEYISLRLQRCLKINQKT